MQRSHPDNSIQSLARRDWGLQSQHLDSLSNRLLQVHPKDWRSVALMTSSLFLATGPGIAQEASVQRRISALIVDGFSNHDWSKTTAFIEATLAGTACSRSPLRPRRATLATRIGNSGARASPATMWSSLTGTIFASLNSAGRNRSNARWRPTCEAAAACWRSTRRTTPSVLAEYDRMIGLGWRDKDHGVALQLDAEGGIRRIQRAKARGRVTGRAKTPS